MDAIVRIRSDTRFKHQVLDETYPFKQLGSGRFSSYEYSLALLVLERWHTALHVYTNGTGFISTHRSAAVFEFDQALAYLRRDLGVLRARYVFTDIPYVTNFAIEGKCESVGLWYVLLGSSLGARQIMKGLFKHRLSRRCPPCEYYALMSRVAGHWPGFIRDLNIYCELHPVKMGEVVRGVHKCFDYLIDCANYYNRLRGAPGATGSISARRDDRGVQPLERNFARP